MNTLTANLIKLSAAKLERERRVLRDRSNSILSGGRSRYLLRLSWARTGQAARLLAILGDI